MKTKLAKAVARLERCLERWDPEDLLSVVPGDLRTVLDFVKEAQGQGLTRAERAVVRAAMHWVHHVGDGEGAYLFTLAGNCRALELEQAEAERAKAKKGGRR